MLSGLFVLTFLASLPAIVVGLISPSRVFPRQLVKEPTRAFVLKIYSATAIGSLFLSALTTPDAFTQKTSAETPAPAASPVSSVVPPSVPSPAAPAPVAASPVAEGLGISKTEIQSIFEKPEIGFVFEDSPLRDGRSRVIGQSPNKLASLELIGNPQNLSTVSIMVGLPNDDAEAVAVNSIYLLGVLKLAAPNWSGAEDWLNDGLEQFAAGETDLKTVQGDRQIHLQWTKELSLLLLTVEAAQ